MFSSIVDRDFFANLVRLACDAAYADGATLFTLDKSRRYLKPFVVHKLPASYICGVGMVQIGTQCCGRAVAHKAPWIVSDMLSDPLFADGIEAAKKSDIRAAFSVPVMTHDGDAFGSLACHYKRPYTPSNDDIERNKTFAALIAFALRHADQADVQRNDWRVLLEAALEECDPTLLVDKIKGARIAVLDRLELQMSGVPGDRDVLQEALHVLRELELRVPKNVKA